MPFPRPRGGPPRSLLRFLLDGSPRNLLPLSSSSSSSSFSYFRYSTSAAAETRTQKLERIADELLDLNKLERHDYAILFRHKLGLNRWAPAGAAIAAAPSAAGTGTEGAKGAAAQAEKSTFDVKLEKFDVAAKIKVIKEVRGFSDLGLKEAKELVEKAPVVVKKQVTKEEAERIAAKLKEVGATVVLE